MHRKCKHSNSMLNPFDSINQRNSVLQWTYMADDADDDETILDTIQY